LISLLKLILEFKSKNNGVLFIKLLNQKMKILKKYLIYKSEISQDQVLNKHNLLFI
jgi:hypothetical protein